MKRQIVVCILSTALVFLFYSSLDAQLSGTAWPMFHGYAARTGQSPNQGSPSGVLEWSYLTGTLEYSSPVIGSDGKVYAGALDRIVYSLNSNGSLLWSYDAADNVRSSPAVGSDGRVYAISDNSNIYGLLSDGSLLWSYNRAGGLTYSSPAIDNDGRVYAGSDFAADNTYLFNSNGSLLWSYNMGGGDSSVALNSDGRVHVGSSNTRIYSLNSIGSLFWSYRTAGAVRSSPAIGSDERVYVGSNDSNIYGLLSDGSLLWSYVAGGPLYSSPAAGSDGRVVVGSNDNTLYSLSSTGSLVWSYTAGDEVGSSPAIGSDGTVYVASKDNTIYGLLSDGSLLWSYVAGGPSYSSPAIGSDGKVVVGSDGDSRLYVFEGPPTPVPNYINLGASPASVSPGSSVTLSWTADFTQWDYQGVPVNIYLAAIRSPLVSDAPSSVSDALGGGTVFLFGSRMATIYRYTGSVREPTFSGVAFPPVALSGSRNINVPANPALAGDWVFATAFIRRDTGVFVRDDGLPVENSNAFQVQ